MRMKSKFVWENKKYKVYFYCVMGANNFFFFNCSKADRPFFTIFNGSAEEKKNHHILVQIRVRGQNYVQ